MTVTIAVAGKGGVGKTTLSGMLIKYLVDYKKGTVLAIDADPSSNLNMVLGLDLEWSVGDIREGLLSQVKDSLLSGGAAMGTIQGGLTKREYLDYHVRSSVAEGDKFDLIAMGRSEGPGCYCAVNHNLREVVDAIGKNYQYVVIDNEAGMEHLSRRTTRDVQHLLVISDPSLRSLVAANRIAEFRRELDIKIEHAYLVINRVNGILPQATLDYIKSSIEIPLLGIIPNDQELVELEMSGRALIDLPDSSPVYLAIGDMVSKML